MQEEVKVGKASVTIKVSFTLWKPISVKRCYTLAPDATGSLLLAIDVLTSDNSVTLSDPEYKVFHRGTAAGIIKYSYLAMNIYSKANQSE